MMAEEVVSSAAAIMVDKVDIGKDYVTTRPAMEFAEGILPHEGGEEKRKVTISSCCLVDGDVFGSEIRLLDCDKHTLSTGDGDWLPGTQINGGLNAFGDVYIGSGAVVEGGVLAGGDVVAASAVTAEASVPSRVIIQGAVCGQNITLGDGVVVLGPVFAQKKLTLGNGVTIRDYAVAPRVEIGDGCLLGGLVATNEISIGDHNTIAASRIVLPADASARNVRGSVRSPYPGCNNCPHLDKVGAAETAAGYGRRLACHLFTKIAPDKSGGLSVKAGTCKAWTAFPLDEPDKSWNFIDETSIDGQQLKLCVISNVDKGSLAIDDDARMTAIWEMTAEAAQMPAQGDS
jgi:carbonic anhydrase/acetyltransferase-like protein (isoleucine patch superfamily)